MSKKQEKEIAELVAEQLNLKLGECHDYYGELHSYGIEGQDATLDVHLDLGVVRIISNAYGETRKEYNIKLTLEEIDLDPTPLEIPPRPEWQQRVIDEERELFARLDKLTRFIETETFNNLPPVEREDLVTQGRCMSDYLKTLRSRISRFGV